MCRVPDPIWITTGYQPRLWHLLLQRLKLAAAAPAAPAQALLPPRAQALLPPRLKLAPAAPAAPAQARAQALLPPRL